MHTASVARCASSMTFCRWRRVRRQTMIRTDRERHPQARKQYDQFVACASSLLNIRYKPAAGQGPDPSVTPMGSMTPLGHTNACSNGVLTPLEWTFGADADKPIGRSANPVNVVIGANQCIATSEKIRNENIQPVYFIQAGYLRQVLPASNDNYFGKLCPVKV